MKKIVLAAALAVAVISVPVLAVNAKHSPMAATMLCRPAVAGEKPMAMMGAKGMECKTMDSMMKNGRMGPDVKGMTAAQTDAAWQAWIQQQMMIQSATGTAGGNG
jgi:hypothetical protein